MDTLARQEYERIKTAAEALGALLEAQRGAVLPRSVRFADAAPPRKVHLRRCVQPTVPDSQLTLLK